MSIIRFPSLCVTTTSPKGSSKRKFIHFTFGVAFHIFVAGNCRHFKFGMWVDRSKSQPMDDKLSLRGAWSHTVAFVCLSVFAHIISKSDADRITNKLDTETFHRESCEPTDFVVKRSKVKVTRHRKHCRHGLWRSCECQ